MRGLRDSNSPHGRYDVNGQPHLRRVRERLALFGF
jgi:hypothetical protein